MHHVRHDNGVVAVGNRILEEVACHHVNLARGRVLGQALPRDGGDCGQIEQGAVQLAVLAQYGAEKGPDATARSSTRRCRPKSYVVARA